MNSEWSVLAVVKRLAKKMTKTRKKVMMMRSQQQSFLLLNNYVPSLITLRQSCIIVLIYLCFTTSVVVCSNNPNNSSTGAGFRTRPNKSAFNRLRKLLRESEHKSNNSDVNLINGPSAAGIIGAGGGVGLGGGGGGVSAVVSSNVGQLSAQPPPESIIIGGRVNRNIHTRNLISYGVVSGGTTDTSGSKDSIHIAGFFPTSSLMNISSEGAIGRGVLPAVKLAIYHINNNNNTLPDYKLHITWNDTKVRGMKAFILYDIFIDEIK